jgi:hypothetical protein
MKRSPRLLLFVLAATVAGLAAGHPARAGEFGSFTLQPGETRNITIGATYRLIRLCNDVGSAGMLDAVIGAGAPIRLAPGLCAEDSGDRIQLRNAANGKVSGVYRRQYDFFDGP